MVMVTTVPLVCNKIMFTQALNVSHREREMAQWSGTLAALLEDPLSVPSTCWLTTICDFSFRDSDTLFWHCIYVVHRHAFRQNVHTHKRKEI